MKAKLPKIDIQPLVKKTEIYLKKGLEWASKHKPEIKITVGTGMLVGAVIKSSFDGRKASDLLREKKEEAKTDTLAKSEVVKTVGKVYLVTIGLTAGGVGLIFSGSADLLKRNMALISRANVMADNYRSRMKTVREEVGEEKMKTITDKLTGKDETVKNDVPRPVYAPSGKMLFRDKLGGHFFWSTPDRIDAAMERANYNMVVNDRVYLTEIYEELGIRPNEFSDHAYWTVADGRILYRTHEADTTDEFDIGFPAGVPYGVFNIVSPPYHDDLLF